MPPYHEQTGGTAEPGGKNASVSLKSYLQDVDDAVRSLPSAWVKCELHTLKVAGKFVKMEFIELDRSGKQVAKANGGCFPSTWQRIDAAFRQAGLPLEEGSQVLVKLEASVNAAYGFNVSVLDIDVTFALGDLNARIQAIRKALRDDGHWDRNRRLPRPADFLRVAVISPSGAAGLGDFRSTADRLVSTGLVQFDYYEAPFQTRDAPARIVDILRRLYREGMDEETRPCAVAIIRGGGASADLAWLVDHKLTEAVCRMNVPVITGIGHERDRNLLDEVACIACDTPSKVAEHVSRTVVQAATAGGRAYEIIQSQSRQSLDHVQSGLSDVRHAVGRDALDTVHLADGLVRAAATGLEPGARALLEETRDAVALAMEETRSRARQRREAAIASVQTLGREIGSAADTALRQLELGSGRAISEIGTRIEGIPSSLENDLVRLHREILEDAVETVEEARFLVTDTDQQIFDDVRRTVDDTTNAIAMILERVDALDPRTVLAAGYAILRDGRGAPLTSIETVRTASAIQAEMRDGTLALSSKPKPPPRKAKTA